MLKKLFKFDGEWSDTAGQVLPVEVRDTELAIPRRIFFFWEGKKLPERYRQNIDYLKAMNPEYDIAVVDSRKGKSVIKSISKPLFDIFDDISIPAVKSDIIRMALLYKYGGWYCDCDSSPRVSPDFWSKTGSDLILFSVQENKKRNIQNSILGGVAGHPFFRTAIEIMGHVVCGKHAHYSVYRSTGPVICMQAASRYVAQEGVLVTPIDYELIDVITGGTKGSWVFQERCGIWSNAKSPVVFRGDTALERFESLDAFEYFKDMFDRYPKNRVDNYRKMLRRAGKHYVHKHGISKEITELSERFIIHSNRAYFKELLEVVERCGDSASSAKIQKILEK